MNREELKELGLTDEQIESVMKAHGQATNTLKLEADKIEGLESQIEDLNGQIKDRDTQLEDLSEKAKGNEDLTEQINQLKEQNDTTKTEYEEKLQKQAFEHKLETTLKDSKVKNVKAIKALLDLETIKLDGDKLLGLDDQLNGLKENESYLFEEEEKPGVPRIVAGGNPQGGTGTKNPFSKEHWNLTEQGKLFKENPELYNAMKAQAGK